MTRRCARCTGPVRSVGNEWIVMWCDQCRAGWLPDIDDISDREGRL